MAGAPSSAASHVDGAAIGVDGRASDVVAIDDGDDEYQLGEKGSLTIHKMLSQHNPVNVIHEFQERNGLHVPNSGAFLKFLDLLGISRASVYSSLCDKLKARLMQRSSKLAPGQREILLQESFRFMRIDELREIPIELLCGMDKIPKKYIDSLSTQAALLETLPLSILRQVWVEHPNLLFMKLIPLYNEFVTDPERLRAYGPFRVPVQVPSDRRAADPVLQQLVQWIGSSFQVYSFCLRILRDRFSTSRHFGYCVLRMELLMALHDCGQQDVVSQDPIRMIAWCLDAAVREACIEGRLLDELRTQYALTREVSDLPSDSNEDPGTISQMQDLSMVLAHPLVANTLLRSIEVHLGRIVSAADDEHLPKDDEPVRLLSHAMFIGTNVRKLLRARRSFKLPKCPNVILRSWYPLLGIVMLEGEPADTTTTSLVNLLSADKAGMGTSLLVSYAMSCLLKNDVARATVLLAVLGNAPLAGAVPPLSVIDRFGLALVSLLTSDNRIRAQLATNADFRAACFDKCLVRLAAKQEVFRLRLFESLEALTDVIPVADIARYVRDSRPSPSAENASADGAVATLLPSIEEHRASLVDKLPELSALIDSADAHAMDVEQVAGEGPRPPVETGDPPESPDTEPGDAAPPDDEEAMSVD